jgi:DHA1 family inner membrane transport protein
MLLGRVVAALCHGTGLLADTKPAAVPLVLLLGVFGFASVPGLITRVTDQAGGVPLAASANVSASNVGNALGAWLGGLAITAGLGYRAPLYVGAAIVLTAVAVMTYTARTTHPTPPPSHPVPTGRPAHISPPPSA